MSDLFQEVDPFDDGWSAKVPALGEIRAVPLEEVDPFDDGRSAKVPALEEIRAVQAAHADLSLPTNLGDLYDPVPLKRFKKADHNSRTRAFYESQGFIVLRADQTKILHGGKVTTLDFMGLFDMIGLRPLDRRVVGIQLTSLSGISSHVREMCSGTVTSFNTFPSMDGKRRVDATKARNLQIWLSMGFEAQVIGWGQTLGRGSRWDPLVRPVTHQTIAEVTAGRRLKHK